MSRQIRGKEAAALRRKWRRWLQSISKDIGTLVWDDAIFWRTNDIAKQAGVIRPENVFYQWTGRVYATYCAIGLRRHTNPNERATYSLGHLVSAMSKHPEVLTRNSYVSLWRADLRREGLADRAFERMARTDGDAVPKQTIDIELNKLCRVRERIVRVANRKIAHRQRRSTGTRNPKWLAYRDGIAVLDDVCRRCHHILLALDPPSVGPSNLDEFDGDLHIVWGQRDSEADF